MRPLVVRCGAFGDMVLLTALIRPLAARFGEPVDILTSGPWSAPLLTAQPGVGTVWTLRSRRTPYWLSPPQQRVVRALRRDGERAVWFCDGNESAWPLLRRAQVQDDAVVAVRDHPLQSHEHATEQWRRLAQLTPAAQARLAVPAPLSASQLAAIAPGCELSVSAAQYYDLDAWLEQRGLAGRPLLTVQPGNKRTMRRGFKRLAVNHKHWPAHHWAQLLRFLRERHPQHALLLLGTGPEYSLNAELQRLAAVDGVYNVADDLPIPRLVALLSRASGLLTVDSGPAHAAAAVGCPQVVLFGKASTALYRPCGTHNAPVEVLTAQVAGAPSMLGITPQIVMQAWQRLPLRA